MDDQFDNSARWKTHRGSCMGTAA